MEEPAAGAAATRKASSPDQGEDRQPPEATTDSQQPPSLDEFLAEMKQIQGGVGQLLDMQKKQGEDQRVL